MDVSCGIGRHAINLAKLGYHVVGFDPSPTFLRRAMQLSNEAGLNDEMIHFYQGEISQLPEVLHREHELAFDGIILMDTVLGYSGKTSDDVRLFIDLYELASSGCVLIVENFNREFSLEHHTRYWIESFPSNLERIITFNSKPGSRISEAEWDFYRGRRGGKSMRHLLNVRLRGRFYSQQELKQIVKKADWKFIRSFGSVQKLKRFSPKDDFHIVMVCRK